MTAQGSPLTRLRRSLANRNVLLALATAAELPRVPLTEALEICLLLRDKEPERFERAALRWHGRLCREVRLSMAEAVIVLAALDALGHGRVAAGTNALLAVCDSHGLEEVGASLEGWLERHGDRTAD